MLMMWTILLTSAVFWHVMIMQNQTSTVESARWLQCCNACGWNGHHKWSALPQRLGCINRVRTDPGKVWKDREFKVEISQVWKIIENYLICGKVWKSHGKCDYWPGKLRCSLHWWLLLHLLLFLHFVSQRNKFFHIFWVQLVFRNIHWHQQSRLFYGLF